MIVDDVGIFGSYQFGLGASAVKEGVIGNRQSYDGRDTIVSEGIMGSSFDRRGVGARSNVGERILLNGDAVRDTPDEPHAGVEDNP